MSLHQQARQLIDQAGVAIQAGNPQYATELLRQSILYNGKDAEAYILLGVALAQTKMPADAENAFKKAVQLAPDNVKARYNLAVHQYTEGQVRAALENARKAAEIDVRHAGSQDLVQRIETELGLTSGEMPKTTAAGNPNPVAYPRPGYEEQPVQTMPFIERAEPFWTYGAWALAAGSLVLAIMFLSVVVPFMGSQSGSAESVVNALQPRLGVMRVLYPLINLAGLAFIALDAINRRGNLLWLLPQAVCGCTGFTWVILPIYLLSGRNK
jgi:tetratricopeptide (TPR) repeat protein